MTIYSGSEIIGNRYRIEAFHGEGGMQEVYRATDLTFSRLVAVKAPKNPSAEKRFQRSAKLAARVNHPNVAKTLDFFEHNGREHLVEELILGIDLGQFLKHYRCLDPFLSAHIFHHIAKGVCASHAAGVFHRDLKPSNIMVTGGDWPKAAKITDFGIAVMAAENLIEAIEIGISKSLSASTTLVGAIPYMAPELIRTPKDADKEADIWAIGAILYELISGQKPFGEQLAAVALIISGNLPPRPVVKGNNGQFGSTLDALCDIIIGTFEPNPANRPTAHDITQACSALCYSAYERRRGTIAQYFIKGKAIGFIQADDGDRVFFHRSSFYGDTPKVGLRVAFSCFSGGGAPRAHPVVPIS